MHSHERRVQRQRIPLGRLGEEVGEVQNWPLESMQSVHQETFSVACNWKIFWENYSECYHCAKIHPELCKVMPLYAKGVFDFADLPEFQYAPNYHTWQDLRMHYVDEGPRDGPVTLLLEARDGKVR